MTNCQIGLSNNEELIIFMSMMSQLENCNIGPKPIYITKPLPEPVMKTIYKDYFIHPETGKSVLFKTLITEIFMA